MRVRLVPRGALRPVETLDAIAKGIRNRSTDVENVAPESPYHSTSHCWKYAVVLSKVHRKAEALSTSFAASQAQTAVGLQANYRLPYVCIPLSRTNNSQYLIFYH